MATKYVVSQSYVVKFMQSEGVKHFRRKKVPHITDEQEIRTKRNCRKMIRKAVILRLSLMMDHISAFTMIAFQERWIFYIRQRYNACDCHFKKKF